MPVAKPSDIQRVTAERDFNQRKSKDERDVSKAKKAEREAKKAEKTETAEAKVVQAKADATANEITRENDALRNSQRMQDVEKAFETISESLKVCHEDIVAYTEHQQTLASSLQVAEASLKVAEEVVEKSRQELNTAGEQLGACQTKCDKAETDKEAIEQWKKAEMLVVETEEAAATAARSADQIRIEYEEVSLKLTQLRKLRDETAERMGVERRGASRTESRNTAAKQTAYLQKKKVDAIDATRHEFQLHGIETHTANASSFMQSYNAAHAAAYSKCYKKITA